MFSLIRVVFSKKVIDNLSDRRSVSLALVYPFIAPDDPQHAVRIGTIDTALIIPPDFAQAFGAEQEATINLVVDGSAYRRLWR